MPGILQTTSTNFLEKNPVWLIYDNFSKELSIGIPNTLNDMMMVIGNLTFYDHYVGCQFYQNGQYNLQFAGTAEYCTNSLPNFANAYCELDFNVNMSVVGQSNQLNILYIVIGVLSFIIFFSLVFLLIFMCAKKKYCRCIKKNKPLDKTVYIEAPRMNHKMGADAPDEVLEVNQKL